MDIEEYSVTQTTLEQIFQNFANQSIASDKAAFTFAADGEGIKLLNPTRTMTPEQEERSQRGLSFATGGGSLYDEPPKLGEYTDVEKAQASDQLLLPRDGKDAEF